MILEEFLIESNRIEGITTPISEKQMKIANDFLSIPYIKIVDIANFVSVFQPGAEIRAIYGLDVVVGNHYPPRGGPDIYNMLDQLVKCIYPIPVEYDRKALHAFNTHVKYETLHPFTDCNGRSGRILWLHMMGGHDWLKHTPYGFKHTWYYHSLNYARKTFI